MFFRDQIGLSSDVCNFFTLWWWFRGVGRFSEWFQILRGLKSKRWFQAWVISEISMFFQDRVWKSSEVFGFFKFWCHFRNVGKASGKSHVSEKVSGLKDGWKLESRQRDPRFLRSGWDFFRFFRRFWLLMVVSRCEGDLKGSWKSESSQGNPSLLRSDWDFFRYSQLFQLPTIVSRCEEGLRGSSRTETCQRDPSFVLFWVYVHIVSRLQSKNILFISEK